MTNNHALPWAVRRGIVSHSRFAPPANRDPALRQWPRWEAARLAALPARVWDLGIDWRRHAVELDAAALVHAVERTLSGEARSHAGIAQSLRRAAHQLKAAGQVDPMFAGALMAAARLDPAAFNTYQLRGMVKFDAAAPRLSDFLRVMEAWFEGEAMRSFGLHRLDGGKQRVGPDGAALEAFDRVRSFMIRHTGKPHDDLVDEIVAAYHPQAVPRDRARAIRARSGKAPRKS